jgi:hypothetical protein
VIEVCFKEWMNKQIVVHPSDEILLSNKKELIPDTHKNVDESYNNYAEWDGRQPYNLFIYVYNVQTNLYLSKGNQQFPRYKGEGTR